MTQTIVLCSLIVLLVLVNLYEKHKANKREQDLLDRLMARSHDEYAANKVRMSTIKPEYIGEVQNPEDETYPVD